MMLGQHVGCVIVAVGLTLVRLPICKTCVQWQMADLFGFLVFWFDVCVV